MANNLYGFTKVRFTGTVYRPKGNDGTTSVSFLDGAGISIYSISGVVCPSEGTKEHEITIPFYAAEKVTLTRYIDTRSDGNSSIKIELYDSYTKTWKQVLYRTDYRTGNGSEAITYTLSDANATFLDILADTVPLKLTKGETTHTVKLTKVRVTEPSMIFTLGNQKLYGALLKDKPTTTTLKVDNDYYLSDPIGRNSIVLYFEMQMEEYRSHVGVGGHFRRIQVFNVAGKDITNKCYFDEDRFWYYVFDHKYEQHWPNAPDTRENFIRQVKPGFDGNYDTEMTGFAYSSKHHTANGHIKVFYVCPSDEYIGKVVYQFGSRHRNVNYVLGWYDENNVFHKFESFSISSSSNFDKTYDLTKV